MSRVLGLILLLTASLSASEIAGRISTAREPVLSIMTSALPDGTIGMAYSQTIEARGGVSPFSWTIRFGALPENLTLGASTSNLVPITGMPDKAESGVAFTIQVTDADGKQAVQSFTVSVRGTPTIVETRYGAVRGVAIKGLYAFRGIPYAAPPVGDLRWKVPQPPTRWKGVRDASKFGNVCPQINSAGQFAGDEDCLVLNVFVSQDNRGRKQPVMVFLHGGGNKNGDTQYTPTPLDTPPLAKKGVVIVTVEYRLGLLGFLAHPLLTVEGGGSSGHYALMDMIAALQWVKQNITRFGGDPHRVMLFGQSAGSYDIQMLLASPAAQGLFSAAGMESNVIPLGQLPAFSLAEAGGEEAASALGCSSARNVLACLRGVSVDMLVNLPVNFAEGPGIGSPFLPRDPFTVLQQNGSPVPLLIGSNREEWSVFDDPNAQLDYSEAIHERFDQFGSGVADEVLSLYPLSDYSSAAYAVIIVDTDFNMSCEVRSVARVATGANREPVWRYFYTHGFENDLSLAPFGAFHTAELFFLFGNFDDSKQPGGGIVYTPSAADLAFSRSLMAYWTRFAATGNPNSAGATAWPQYDASTESMLQLDDTFAPISRYHNPQCDYLETLPQP